MSDLNSWEDEEEKLSQQTQQNLNLNNLQANTFRPGATSFQVNPSHVKHKSLNSH